MTELNRVNSIEKIGTELVIGINKVNEEPGHSFILKASSRYSKFLHLDSSGFNYCHFEKMESPSLGKSKG